MSGKTLPIIVIVFVVLAGGYFFWQTGSVEDEVLPEGRKVSEGLTSTLVPTMGSVADDDQGAGVAQYLEYSKESFEQHVDKRRVLFFHASWCPTCQVANNDFIKNISQVPNDVVVFKLNYDKESDLKKQYDVVYQHTFVLVDEKGNTIQKWSGGGVDELVQRVR